MQSPQHILESVFGYSTFIGPQEAIVRRLADGGDAIVLMPTGGGKSLCYQIPALVRDGVGIIVSPLIALMQDQVDALKELGVAAAFLNSSLTSAEAASVERDTEKGRIKLLYVAPERLLMPRFLALLDSLADAKKLALFAIDEAHCVSQWGHDFRADYLQLSVLAERYPQVPRAALTATADAMTRQEIRERLRLYDATEYVASFDRPNIRYSIAEREDEHRQLRAFLAEREGESGIVYCLSRKKVDATAAWLVKEGFRALPYHAGMDSDDRRRNQSTFLRDEEAVIIVATIAFGMGIDKPDVRFVAHLDLPKSMESYYQETGRAGRDGEPSDAWMLYGLTDVVQQRRLIDTSEADEAYKRVSRGKLDALLGLCETPNCRRARLLNYFGEMQPAGSRCGNCDNCLAPPETWDASEPVRMALSAVYRTGQRYGAGYLLDVLRGNASTAVKDRGHDTLSVFGIGQALSDGEWRSIFRQLIALGWVDVDSDGYGTLRLNDAARPVLRGEARALLRRMVETGALKRRKKPAAAIEGLDDEAAALFERLKAWRRETAAADGVPAYVILHDRVLREIASTRPGSLATLQGISGIGDNKLKRFGKELLEIVA